MPRKAKSKQGKKQVMGRQYLEPWQNDILLQYRAKGMSTMTPDLLHDCHIDSKVSIERIKRWTGNKNHPYRKPPKGLSTEVTTWHIFSEDYEKENPFSGEKHMLGQHSKDRGKAYQAAMKNKKKRADLVKRTEERKRTAVQDMTPQQRRHAIKKIHVEIEKKCKKLKVFGFETATLTFAVEHAPAVDGSAHVVNFMMYEANTMLLKCHEHLFGNLDPKLLKTDSLAAYIRSRFNYLYAQALGVKDTMVSLPYTDIAEKRSPVLVKGLPEGIPVKSPDRYRRAHLEQIYLGLSSISVEIQTRPESTKDKESSGSSGQQGEVISQDAVAGLSGEVISQDAVAGPSGEVISQDAVAGPSGEVSNQDVVPLQSKVIENDMGSHPTAMVLLEALANGGTLPEEDLTDNETDSITIEQTHNVEIQHIFSTSLLDENEGESHVKDKTSRKRRAAPLKEKNSSVAKRRRDEGVEKKAETVSKVKEVRGGKKAPSKPKGRENVMAKKRKMITDGKQVPRRSGRHAV